MDLVFRCDQFPREGETRLGGSFETHPGGKGANQAVAAGRLGGSVRFAGCVGRDSFGDALLASLQDAGVDTAPTRRVDKPSGTACILVNEIGINEIVVASGANLDVTPGQVRTAMASRPRIVLCQLEIPMLAVEAASEADRFVLNPAPAASIPDSVAGRCFLITPNEGELAGLTGISITDEKSLDRAGRALLDRGVENVVVTLGERGSYWISSAGGKHFEAPRVEAVDTTAAGDAFNGALAVFLDEGLDLGQAIPLANRVGAISATRRGAQPSMPTRRELEMGVGR